MPGEEQQVLERKKELDMQRRAEINPCVNRETKGMAAFVSSGLAGDSRLTLEQIYLTWKKTAIMKGYFSEGFSLCNYRSETPESDKEIISLFAELLYYALFLKQSWYTI